MGQGAPGGQLLHLGFHGHVGELRERWVLPLAPIRIVPGVRGGQTCGAVAATFCDWDHGLVLTRSFSSPNCPLPAFPLVEILYLLRGAEQELPPSGSPP